MGNRDSRTCKREIWSEGSRIWFHSPELASLVRSQCPRGQMEPQADIVFFSQASCPGKSLPIPLRSLELTELQFSGKTRRWANLLLQVLLVQYSWWYFCSRIFWEQHDVPQVRLSRGRSSFFVVPQERLLDTVAWIIPEMRGVGWKESLFS